MTTALTRPTLGTTLNQAMLADMLSNGYIRAQEHPALPYVILNYTEKAAYESVWNEVTLTCRGLIYHRATGELLARPFGKFFNYGQTGAPTLNLLAPTIAADKMDGSLGILYPTPAGHAIATRGSFASDQAIHATEVWQQRYADQFKPEPGVTYLFEIVYPSNRIVVDYGTLDDLVLLGAIDIATGRDAPEHVPAAWPGPRAEVFPYATLTEALAASPRPNREGLVVHFPETGHRIKLKQDDYVALHRIVTGLNARTVWQHLIDGKPLADLIAPLPDEFHAWVKSVAEQILDHIQAETWRLEEEYTTIRDAMPDDWTAGDRASRAEFAKTAAKHTDSWAMFALLDGKDIRPKLLHNAKPEPYITPSGRIFTEDNA